MLDISETRSLDHRRIYYYVMWTDNGSILLEADRRRQERKYPMIKVLRGCILKLSLYLVHSVLILYRKGNMQSAILLSFVASSSLRPCRLQSTHPQMSCHISPYIYNVYRWLCVMCDLYAWCARFANKRVHSEPSQTRVFTLFAIRSFPVNKFSVHFQESVNANFSFGKLPSQGEIAHITVRA